MRFPPVSELYHTPNRGYSSEVISARRWSGRVSEGTYGFAVQQVRIVANGVLVRLPARPHAFFSQRMVSCVMGRIRLG